MKAMGLEGTSRTLPPGYMSISPSGANTIAACSMQYKYSRIDKLQSVPSLPLVYGNAMHDGYEALLRQKMNGEKISVDAVRTTEVEAEGGARKPLEEYWYSHEGETWAGDQPTKALLTREFKRLLRSFEVFAEEWVPVLEPVLLEPLLAVPVPGGEGNNLYALGFIDLVARYQGRLMIIDYKSARELPKVSTETGLPSIDAGYRQQLASYCAKLWDWELPNDGEDFPCALLYTSKDDSPRLLYAPCEITQREVTGYAKKLVNYSEIVTRGLFTCNRSYKLCSEKFCGFWEICHEQFG